MFWHRCSDCGRGLLFKHKQRGLVQCADCRADILYAETWRREQERYERGG